MDGMDQCGHCGRIRAYKNLEWCEACKTQRCTPSQRAWYNDRECKCPAPKELGKNETE
jgi:hypothetical protein